MNPVKVTRFGLNETMKMSEKTREASQVQIMQIQTTANDKKYRQLSEVTDT